MSIPVFTNLETNNQLDELQSYIASKGINIEQSHVDSVDKLKQIIQASEALWNETGIEYELEMVFNSIICMVIVMPRECIGPPTTLLSSILSIAHPPHDKRNASKLKLLNNLFAGLQETSPLRYTVYSSLVSLAGQAELLHLINIRLPEIKEWVVQWEVGLEKHQKLLSIIYKAYLSNKMVDKASKVMVELLYTYTKENAAIARDDARKCIAWCIAEPSMLVLEHLRLCEPVKFIEGEPLHDLLLLFIGGRLKDYLEFEKKHPEVISTHNLSSQDNIKKMRLLTFCSMADNKQELTFDEIMQELLLPEAQLEPFLSEVLKSKVAQIRIEQTKRKVLVHSSMSRIFNNQQWTKLLRQLQGWRSNLELMTNTLTNVMTATAM